MRIGVISDTHGSLIAWQKALKILQDVDLILHAGDVLYHGPRNPLPEGYQPAELAEELKHCPIPLMIVQGNCDCEVDQMVLSIPIQSPYLITDQPVGRILLTHGHRYNEEQVTELSARYKIDIWISGHTHVPVLKKQGDTILLNPGSTSLPKGEELHTGVAIINSEKIELIDLDTKRVSQGLRLRWRS